ncbi:ephexin-1 isoform x1 [Limosa lapponica baueri]|uniref:Ephexin-1 isoform x1 n=1 Tax=Limosa lapponica baueri TaxID=1758121 RepID=A0A2I0TLR1_LIMLA|nr:ephexin-1 isoform x1 [Limosa lapponica baueri]
MILTSCKSNRGIQSRLVGHNLIPMANERLVLLQAVSSNSDKADGAVEATCLLLLCCRAILSVAIETRSGSHGWAWERSRRQSPAGPLSAGSLKNNEPVKEPLNVLSHKGSPSPVNSDKPTLDELWIQSVEDQDKYLPSKGACLILHCMVLISEPSCVGVMHHAFPGTFPYEEDSSGKNFSQTVKLDLN